MWKFLKGFNRTGVVFFLPWCPSERTKRDDRRRRTLTSYSDDGVTCVLPWSNAGAFLSAQHLNQSSRSTQFDYLTSTVAAITVHQFLFSAQALSITNSPFSTSSGPIFEGLLDWVVRTFEESDWFGTGRKWV